MLENDDWDDIMCQENNSYNNPDTAFDCPDNAYEAGYYDALENDGDAIDFNEIEFPSMTSRTTIKAYKVGYKDGCTAW
jgi:hypothetical protein